MFIYSVQTVTGFCKPLEGGNTPTEIELVLIYRNVRVSPFAATFKVIKQSDTFVSEAARPAWNSHRKTDLGSAGKPDRVPRCLYTFIDRSLSRNRRNTFVK
jgi:hypothetical protein